jgi:ribose transport system substrate-binding protein
MKRIPWRAAVLTLGALSLVPASSCGGPPDERPQLAFVTNCVDPFWNIAKAGVRDAAEEFDVRVDVREPSTGQVDEQQRMVLDLLTRGVDGIALSPIDGRNQVDLINRAALETHVICHDSDAPASNRLCFVGVDNYQAGWSCGELVKQALPAGGEVILFVGRLEQDNARLRRQGVIDCLLGREPDAERYDPPDARLEGGGFVILDTRTDGGDQARARANAEDALVKYPDLDGMIGLFAYNPPACVEALEAAGRRGEVAVAAFDEADATLDGIAGGWICGTVTQAPYSYGYESVRLLSALARGYHNVLPEGGVLHVPTQVVQSDNVEEFRAELERLRGDA